MVSKLINKDLQRRKKKIYTKAGQRSGRVKAKGLYGKSFSMRQYIKMF